MPVYMEVGHALRGDRIFAKARTIDTPQQVKEKEGKLIKSTTLRKSAFCVIEKPMRAVSNPAR